MARKLGIIALLSLYLLSPAAALADGDIYAGGPYGTKITSLPYVINSPGAYYLGGDLSYSGNGEGIAVDADNVTLDLMGFTLTSTGSGINNYGISIRGRNNVEIRNGTVRGWYVGISDHWAMLPIQVRNRVFNIRAEECRTGVSLSGDGTLIQGCTAISSVLHASGFVIDYGTGIITGCVVKNCDGYGIIALGGVTVISGNVVVGNAGITSVGIFSSMGLVMGNEVSNCGATGIWVQGPASLIGNSVNTSGSSQTGISIQNPSDPTLLDQNTVTGPGTHYSGTSSAQWRNNGG
jgi:hypothetical protein